MARTVVISGGSRGIGACIAKAFGALKDNVVINYNKSAKEAENVAREVLNLGGKPLIVKADISKDAEAKYLISEAIKVFGKVDVLVCNAGISGYSLLIDASYDQIREIIDTNLIGTINLCKSASENMIKNQSGAIINISSMWGIIGGAGESVYSASKAGLIGFSKALAKELGLSGITVNVVAPGVINTDMIKNLDEQTLNSLSSQTALNRIGTVDDVAGVVEFLASPKASYITGQVISVDGGIV